MRKLTQPPVSRHFALAALPLCAALSVGCQGAMEGPSNGKTGGSGTPSGGNGTGTGGGNGGSSTGSGGGTGTGTGGAPATACTGNSDPRLVVAPQRILRLTMNETLNTVRYLIDATEATALVTKGLIGTDGDDNRDVDRHFPPLQETNIIGSGWSKLDLIAQDIRDYVQANYATLAMSVAGCNAVTDTCATSYVNKLAVKAYRRALSSAESTRFTALYNKLKSQVINGYQVTSTVQEAAANAVYGLLSSPEMLWRWEIGNTATASTAPAGVYLTDAELATHVSFFLTDNPPDDTLMAAVTANTVRSGLTSHINRLLATQASKDWLRKIIETYYLINQLPKVSVDTMKFPVFSSGLVADMQTEAQKFLDEVLWNGNLTDILTSRTAFLNTGLATDIYKVPAPAGATGTNFAKTTLPTDQRSGLITNAAFLTARGRSDGIGMVIPRGKALASAVLCTPPPPPPDAIKAAVEAAKANFATQTGQEQVAARKAVSLCASCHVNFDPYGLVLEFYDTVGRYRATYDYLSGMPAIDGHTNMPAALGGEVVANAIEMSTKLAASPNFTNCMARTMLQYALVDFSAPVELPELPKTAGCATADVVSKYNAGSGKTFTDLLRATAATPAFVLRQVVQ